jgi:hypothetical protein
VSELLLGDLVELIVRRPSGALEQQRPAARVLTWEPRAHRLWSCQLLGRLARRPSAADEARALAFHWAARAVELLGVQRPRQEREAQPVGELAAVVYLAAKEGRPCEWIHWFRSPPQLRMDRAGEVYFLGRVEVDGRGIVS